MCSGATSVTLGQGRGAESGHDGDEVGAARVLRRVGDGLQRHGRRQATRTHRHPAAGEGGGVRGCGEGRETYTFFKAFAQLL